MITFGTTTYELSLTRNYVSRWGMAHAVRELIQNALDSESPFVYEFLRGEDDTVTLRLTSEFTTLRPQTLLLGATSKTDSRDSIGSFGEGYKIALLVLTRLGYVVEIHNGDVCWRPRFRHSKRFDEELLVVEESSLDHRNQGLTFFVQGLDAPEVEEIRASCLQMQDHIGQVHRTRLGDILLERPGKLYVGGLFVCDTSLHYGYNIKPEHLRLERDRQTVSTFDLQWATKDMWFDTERYDEIAKMIEQNVPDLEYAEHDAPQLVREACYRLFRESNPGAVIAKSQQELKELVKQGMPKVAVYHSNFAGVVRSSASYRSESYTRVATPRQRLEAWFQKAKYHMHDDAKRSFRALLEESNSWKT